MVLNISLFPAVMVLVPSDGFLKMHAARKSESKVVIVIDAEITDLQDLL
jgi:hypothetical protein